MKLSIATLVFLIGCQSTANITPSTDVVRSIVKSQSIPEASKELIFSSLRDVDRQIQVLSEAYEKLLLEYNVLEKEHSNLQEKFADASRDAGFKDTFLLGFWGLVSLIGLALIGYTLYLIQQGKIRIPFLVG